VNLPQHIKPELISKDEKYKYLVQSIASLMDPESSMVTNMANLCAAIQSEFHFWWCGFYTVSSKGILELGPFQGPVACTRIAYNKGVCGSSWAQKRTLIVPDVHKFEGHIACSSESNSEIVVPVFRQSEVIAVLDIDSTEFDAFDDTDKTYLEQIIALLP
jgi:GAF domain-containing protein